MRDSILNFMLNLRRYLFRYTIVAVASAIVNFGYAQDDKDGSEIYLQSKGGFLMAHRSAMAHLVRYGTYGFELGYIKHLQSSAADQWYRHPAIGLSLEFRNFGYDEVLGQAISASYFFDHPIFQSPDFFVDFQYGTGLGYLTKIYDLEDNLTNNAIGSHFNARITLKFLFTKYFNNYSLGGGVEISHFSNGAITFPNLGLNTPSIFLHLGFLQNKRKSVEEAQIITKDSLPICGHAVPKHKRIRLAINQVTIASIFAIKQVRANPNLPKRYPVFGLRATYKRRFSKKWSWEGSIDLLHNEANLFVYPDSTFVRSDVMQVGLYAGASYQFYKSQVVMGLGYYVRDIIEPLGSFYNTIGYRYHFTDRWFGLMSIRANLGKADFFEFGVGYNIWGW